MVNQADNGKEREATVLPGDKAVPIDVQVLTDHANRQVLLVAKAEDGTGQSLYIPMNPQTALQVGARLCCLAGAVEGYELHKQEASAGGLQP